MSSGNNLSDGNSYHKPDSSFMSHRLSSIHNTKQCVKKRLGREVSLIYMGYRLNVRPERVCFLVVLAINKVLILAISV